MSKDRLRYKIKPANMKKVLNDIKKKSAGFEQKVQDEANLFLYRVHRGAVNNLRRNLSGSSGSNRLMTSLQVETAKKKDVFSGNVHASVFYAPYVEFGTITKVKVPRGYEDFAILFKVSNRTTGGMAPKPYLIPSFEEEKRNLPDILKKIDI